MSISMLAKAFLHVASHSKQLVHGGYGAIRLGLINPGPAVALRGGVMTRFKADDTAVGRKTITELTTMDHRVINNLYQEFKSPGADKQRLGYTIVREIATHSSAEEEVMYPELRRRMGDAAADQLLAEHQQLKETLYDLSSMKRDEASPDSAAKFDAKVNEAMQILNSHVQEEEQQFWPEFERLPDMTKDALIQLGVQFAGAKDHAVTRPHPAAPNKPPLNVVANAMTAPLDAVLDRWRFAFDVPRPTDRAV